jgi:flagellar secretion chaperone FliS
MTTMMNDARAAYMGNSVSTADPAQLLVLLCDRLVLDVRRALAAQQQDRHDDARRDLVHAQEIVMELRSSLDVDGFAGARELASVYDYIHHRLVLANIHRDAAVTEECESLVTQIADTWRQAALSLARTA